jgi:glycosyltransferase involved in cell wall biosynthesis
MPVRVLTVGNMYPPHHYGGYEIVWRAAVEQLRAHGHAVRVLTTDTRTDAVKPDDPDVHRELRWPLRDARFMPLGRRAKVALARHNHRVLGRHLDEFRPDVVGWWSMGGLTLTMLESVRRRGIPAVAFVHDDWLDYGRWADGWLRVFRGRRRYLAPFAGRLAGIPARIDFDGAAKYVFVSDHTRLHALAQGLGISRTGVAHSGIHEDYLDPAPEQEWGWRLLYVGRLDPRKGVQTAVESLIHLPAATTLELIGGWDAQAEEDLRAQARELGVEARVRFSGQRGRVEIASAYADCDVVVFPVEWEEPWGLVPLEAMARGRPVLATGRGGSAEYLRDGENCLLFEARDARALARAVERLAADPALRARLRERGFETAPRHTEAVLNEAVERELLAATGAQRPAQVA